MPRDPDVHPIVAFAKAAGAQLRGVAVAIPVSQDERGDACVRPPADVQRRGIATYARAQAQVRAAELCLLLRQLAALEAASPEDRQLSAALERWTSGELI